MWKIFGCLLLTGKYQYIIFIFILLVFFALFVVHLIVPWMSIISITRKFATKTIAASSPQCFIFRGSSRPAPQSNGIPITLTSAPLTQRKLIPSRHISSTPGILSRLCFHNGDSEEGLLSSFFPQQLISQKKKK